MPRYIRAFQLLFDTEAIMYTELHLHQQNHFLAVLRGCRTKFSNIPILSVQILVFRGIIAVSLYDGVRVEFCLRLALLVLLRLVHFRRHNTSVVCFYLSVVLDCLEHTRCLHRRVRGLRRTQQRVC